MAKKVKRTKKAARRKEASGKSLLSRFFHKKHRPLHGVAAGSILVLLHSFWIVLAFVGWILIILSALAFFAKKKD